MTGDFRLGASLAARGIDGSRKRIDIRHASDPLKALHAVVRQACLYDPTQFRPEFDPGSWGAINQRSSLARNVDQTGVNAKRNSAHVSKIQGVANGY